MVIIRFLHKAAFHFASIGRNWSKSFKMIEENVDNITAFIAYL